MLNPNGYFIELVALISNFFGGINSYLIIVLLSGYVFLRASIILMSEMKTSIAGWLYFLLFLLPLYTVQLRAGVGVSLAFLAMHRRSLLFSTFAFGSHFSTLIFSFNIVKLNILLALFTFILVYFISDIFLLKYEAYYYLYKTTKVDQFTFWNYKVFIAILVLIYNRYSGRKMNYLSKYLSLGILSYFVLSSFPILSHRISELCFYSIPLVINTQDNRKYSKIARMFLGIVILFFGLKFSIFNSGLWLVQ